MENINEETKNYIGMFHNPLFTEHDFVACLLPLLYQNGVNKIKERDLAQKLYFYYEDENYKELFQEITLTRGAFDKEVDIHEGMYQEKFFSGCIYWDSMRGEPLFLNYNKNSDISFYEKNLSIDGKHKMRQMAFELALIYKLEEKNFLSHIYKSNPNLQYLLLQGKYYGKLVGFELFTDGDIENIEYPSTKGTKSMFYESPICMNEYIRLKDKKIAYVTLKNASYAIKQAIYENNVKYNIINSPNINKETLEKILEIASRRYEKKEFSITLDNPLVRKISLG